MTPSLHDGDIVLVRRRNPRVGQVAIFRRGDKEVIKRVSEVKGARFYVLGDNAQESTDSRHYGYVTKRDILGTIMLVLPRAIDPPKLVISYGAWVGRLMAVLFTLAALIHLFRIDTWIPLLDVALPSGPLVALLAGIIILLSEVFAIPFALRMKLSPLTHIVSGALIVFAPLWWVAVDILAYGTGYTTGQLGEFVTVTSQPIVMGLNLLWFGAAFFTLYALGYDRLTLRRGLRK